MSVEKEKLIGSAHVACCIGTDTTHSLETLRGVLRYANERGGWQFARVGVMPVVPLDRLSGKSCDGIVAAVTTAEDWQVVADKGVPVVNLSNRLEGVDLPRVGPDDGAIGQMAAEYLLERGFTELAFAGFPEHWYSDRRHAAFEHTVQAAGRHCHSFLRQSSKSDPTSLRAWLGSLPHPVGLLAANDIRGRHVVEACLATGLRVPEDVAVVGVDNDEWQAAMANLPLTSIDPDGRRTGYEAAAMLDSLLAGRTPAASQVWVPPAGVVTRRSTDIFVAQDPAVSKAVAYIQEHLAGALTVEDVCEHVALSRRNLELRFRRGLGCTPYAFIRQARVKWAQRLLLDTDLGLKEIAHRCGFGPPERLSVVFKEVSGETPGAYRKRFQL